MAGPKELFRDIYREKRERNAFKTHFLPAGRLKKRLGESAIDQLLSVCAVSEGSYPHVRSAVIDGGVTTLCILFHIDLEKSITAFVGNCHNGLLDHKLPFNEQALKNVWSDRTKIDSFHDAQWEFLAPVFDGRHHVFEDQVILPFMSDHPIDSKYRGLNSDIFEITIMENHLKSSEKSAKPAIRNGHNVTRAIRKELANSEDSDRERNTHSRLGQLKHPNILGVYGTYVQNRRLNLLLPAMNCRLSDLYADEDEEFAQERFPTDMAYFTAMSGLVDAVKSLHNFRGQSIGCHHDIKPGNILLDGSSFVLADFGLTTFKQPLEYSKSTTSRFDPYLAPECLDTSTGYRKHKVGRASDTWSLACILVELLVFMVWRKAGTDKFRNDRAQASTPGLLGCPFYNLNSRGLNEVVLERLREIQCINTPKRLLVDLLLEILRWDPEQRPDSQAVYVTLKEICKTAANEQDDIVIPELISPNVIHVPSVDTGQSRSRPKPPVPSKGEHLSIKLPKKNLEHLEALLRLDLRLEEQGRVKSLWQWDQCELAIKKWAALQTSKILLIISMDEERFRRPISHVSAKIIDSARKFLGSRKLVCIAYFCQEASPYRVDDLPKMFRSLLNQLYENVWDLKPAASESQPRLQSILEVFEELTQTVMLLPSDATVVCVIDSLDHYQRRGHHKETNDWIRRLTAIVHQSSARFKLLLTLPSLYGGLPSLSQYDIRNDDVLQFHGGDDDDRYGLDKNFWIEHPLQWS